MGGYNKFNVVFNINGVEFVDCRAYLKVDNWLYKRVGADSSNTVNQCLSADSLEGICLAEQIDYNTLLTEEEMNLELSGGF